MVMARSGLTIRVCERSRRYRARMIRTSPNASYCARPGCGGTATATLTYHYPSRTVWLDPAGIDPEAGWGLCATHAETLKVPVGWALDDRRPVEVPPLPGQRPVERDVPPAIAV